MVSFTEARRPCCITLWMVLPSPLQSHRNIDTSNVSVCVIGFWLSHLSDRHSRVLAGASGTLASRFCSCAVSTQGLPNPQFALPRVHGIAPSFPQDIGNHGTTIDAAERTVSMFPIIFYTCLRVVARSCVCSIGS